MSTLKKLILESEDEFNVTPDESWNYIYLKVEDEITPDMWDKTSDAIWDLMDLDLDKTYKIKKFSEGIYNIIFVTLTDKTNKETHESLSSISNALKSPYQIALPNDLVESEDEFNITPGEDWSMTYLSPGDNIIGKMWDWEKIIKMINKEHRDDHRAVYQDIELWKQIYDEGVTIKSFEEFDGIPWVKFDRLITWGPSIKFTNNLLNPKYKIPTNDDLVESEDEFNVTPGEEWNVTYLRAGDTITSDMWKDNSKRSPMYILGFEWDQSREEVLVVLEVLYTDYPIQYWDIDVVNERLKPEFQVTDDSNLMENEDEFNVTPGEQWNQIELTMGDTITPDMWKDKTNISIADVPVQIVGWGNEDEDEDENEPGMDVYIMLNTPDGYTYDVDLDILNDVLKPKFRVTIDNDLRENEDEFNVTPNEDWNVTYLQVGDKVTYDMVKDGSDAKKVMDKYFGKDAYIELIDFKNGMYRVRQYNPKDGSFTTPYQVVPEWFNNYTLNSQYQLDVPLGNRVDIFAEGEEDEFNVDASEDWNIIELGIGDTITPDMWEDVEFNKFNKRETWTIDDIYYNEGFGWTVELTSNENGFDNLITLLSLNRDYLKPKFQVVNSEVLEEDEDEFNITPSEEWNVEKELKKGNTITPNMWNVGKLYNDVDYEILINYIEPAIEQPLRILDIDNKFVYVAGKEDDYKYPINWINKYLNSKYQVSSLIENSSEQEDEFNITPGKQWNVDYVELGEGDIITPEMWNPEEIKNGNIYDLIDDPTEPWYIDQISNRDSIWMTTETGGEVATHLQYVNDMLLPGYRVGEFINESEDEFNITPNEEWSKLTVGDTIFPHMWNPEHIDVFNTVNDKTIDWYIEKISDIGNVTLIPEKGRQAIIYINILNEKFLKPEYQVFVPEYVNESDDEFSVDAPKEWNIKDLGINSYLDSTNMNISSGARYKIVNFSKSPDGKELVGLIKLTKDTGNEDDESKYISSWYIDFVNRKLKPGYEVVYGYVAPKQLDESDDEFNITPSVLWNLDLDTPINITITKEFKVTDWNTDTSAISIETTLIKTSVAQLQEESGENYNYDEITVKNITNWINENSEVVIALFDMDGKEEKSWHDVDRDFKPSSNNLDYELVDMDISVEIPESNLNESDEDFNVTPNKTWNTIEVGDIIEPYMWLDPKKTSRYLLVGNYGAGLKLKRVLSKEDETLNPGDEDRWMYNDPNIIQVITDLFNDKLKPEYRFTGHLNESDEDFNITPSEDWNVVELGVGDTLDPTNLKMQDWSKKYIIDKIEKRHGIWDYVYLDLYKYNPKLKDWEIVKQFSNDLNSVNDTLKPGFKIQEP